MRYTIITATTAALLLSACEPGPTATPAQASSPVPRASPSGSVALSGGVEKFCDQGRAVYAYSSYKVGAAIAVVENAAECAS